MKKKTLLFMILLPLLLLLPVRAANYALVMDSPTTAVGNDFLIRLRLKNSAWKNDTAGSVALRIRYDSDSLEYVGAYGGLGEPEAQMGKGELILRDQGRAEEYYLRLHFKALRAGESTVELTEVVVKDPAGNPMDCELGSSTVTVQETGDEAGLFSIYTVPGDLSPGFSTDVRHYELQVGADVSAIQVAAKPIGYYASAYVEGHYNLREGHNCVTISTLSGGGVAALYTIDVIRSSAPSPTPKSEAVVIPTAALPEEEEPTPEPVESVPTPTAAPTAKPTARPAPTDTPKPEAKPEAKTEATPAAARESEESAKAQKTREDMELALQDAAAATKAAKVAIAVCMGEFLVIVLLCLYIWRNMRPFFSEPDDEEDEDDAFDNVFKAVFEEEEKDETDEDGSK